MATLTTHLTQLGSALGDRRVTPSIPAGRAPRTIGLEVDAKAKPRDGSASWTAYIRYEDAKGEETERRFTCHSLSGFGAATHLDGFCHERLGHRTFLVERIRELVCAETGEVLDPGTHFEMLRETGALRVKDKVLTEVGRLLVFLARCDGQYHPMERSALEDIVSRYCVRFGGTDRMAIDATEACGRIAPDSRDMVTAIRRIATLPNERPVARFVLDCGAAVIDADGRHSAEELSWAVEMSASLKCVSDGRVG